MKRYVNRSAQQIFMKIAFMLSMTFAGAMAHALDGQNLQPQGNQAKAKSQQVQAEALASVKSLSNEIQALKVKAVALNTELRLLEDELLFPANTQCVLFLSIDSGKFFKLENIKLKIDGQTVSSHLYSDKQRTALERGGMQRLFVGNLGPGEHKLTALFTGEDGNQRRVKRAAALEFEKKAGAKYIEIKIADSAQTLAPTFSFKQW